MTNSNIPPFVRPSAISQLIGLSETYIRKLRQENTWSEGIHYVTTPAGMRYNTAICLHWMATQNQPKIHQDAIKKYEDQILNGDIGALINIYHNPSNPSSKCPEEKSA